MSIHVRYFAIVLFLTFLVVSCSKPPESKIVGEWKGTDTNGRTIVFIFSENGDLKLIQENLVLEGGTKGISKFSWRLDTDQDPMHLDFIRVSSKGESQTLPTIVRFITDSKIQLRQSEDKSSRPIQFSESDNFYQILLTRQ